MQRVRQAIVIAVLAVSARTARAQTTKATEDFRGCDATGLTCALVHARVVDPGSTGHLAGRLDLQLFYSLVNQGGEGYFGYKWFAPPGVTLDGSFNDSDGLWWETGFPNNEWLLDAGAGLPTTMQASFGLSACNSPDWGARPCGDPLAFRTVTFAPVQGTLLVAPEPGTLTLLGSGLAGLAFVVRKRRRHGPVFSR